MALLFTFVSSRALTWNALGHQLIAKIAYDQLSSDKQALLNHYNQAIDEDSFAKSATWMDRQFGRDFLWLKPLHYVDFPYSTDSTRLERENQSNALTAIQESLLVLKDPNASIDKKALHLRILIHVVGDIHQPMHAISRYSRRFPNGDKGGNLFLLKSNPIAANLHAYWDNGGGYLKPHKKSSYRKKRHYNNPIINSNAISAISKSLAFWRRLHETKEAYPCHTMSMSQDVDPNQWAKESWTIAVNQAYKIHFHQKPGKAYQKMVKQVSKQRIALAGCRLAVLLNSI